MAAPDQEALETATRAPVSPKPPQPPDAASRTRQAAWPAGLLAGAWLIPSAANGLHLDWVLPIFLVLGTASLLRAGHTLLDRLVIATAFAAGFLIVAGVLFSLWPWGLEPVPVAGFCFTVLVAVGTVLFRHHGRRPAIPTRVRGSDLIILAAPILTWVLMRRPFAGRSFVQSLPYMAPNHDGLSHFSLFDAIHQVGGYQAFHSRQAAPIIDGGMRIYMPGAHYLYVLLDIFRRSTTAVGTAQQEFLRYNQYVILGLCCLSLALPWAARWIAGPAATGYRRSLVCTVVAALAVFGQFSTLYYNGFDAEILGLAFLAVIFAVLARPPRSPGEQVLIVGLLLVAQAFVYDLFLLNAGFAVLAALRLHWSRIRPVWPLAVGTALAVAALSAIPLGPNFNAPTLSIILTVGGVFVGFSRPLSVGFALIAVAGVFTRTGRRSTVWKITGFVVAMSCVIAVYTELLSRVKTGTQQYYSEKLVESAWVLALCGFGAIALFLKNSPGLVGGRQPAGTPAAAGTNRPRLRRRPRTRIRSGEFATGVLAVLLGLVFADGFPMSGHSEKTGPEPQTTSVTVIWSRGHIDNAEWGAAIAAYSRVAPLGDGVRTVIVLGTPRINKVLTTLAAVLNHRMGEANLIDVDRAPYDPSLVSPDNPDLSFVTLNGVAPNAVAGSLSAPEAQALRKVEKWLLIQPPGLRFAVANPGFADLVRHYAAAEPQLRLAVVFVPGIPPAAP